jgi:hypothetical protein
MKIKFIHIYTHMYMNIFPRRPSQMGSTQPSPSLGSGEEMIIRRCKLLSGFQLAAGGAPNLCPRRSSFGRRTKNSVSGTPMPAKRCGFRRACCAHAGIGGMPQKQVSHASDLSVVWYIKLRLGRFIWVTQWAHGAQWARWGPMGSMSAMA